MSAGRRAELAANLTRVEERLTAACEAAGRSRKELTLVVVTKTYPASDVLLLAELGVEHVAENRDQEAAAKAAECAEASLTWHFVGQLQTNKAKSVARYADFVHSVDRLRLVSALSSAAVGAGRELGCLVQIALDAGVVEAGGRGGAGMIEIRSIADAIARAPGLRLDGVMAVAPLAGPFGRQPRAAFEKLADVASSLRVSHPAATMVSAGMSGDLEDAVAAGATHVRIGTAVLGARTRLG